jgi:hypothetical protein
VQFYKLVVQVSIDIRNSVYFPVIWCEQLLVLSTVISVLIASVTDLHVTSCEAHPIGQVLDWELHAVQAVVASHACFQTPMLRSYARILPSRPVRVQWIVPCTLRGTGLFPASSSRTPEGCNLRTEGSVLDLLDRCPGAARLVSLPGGYDRRVSAAPASAALLWKTTERMALNLFVDGHRHSIGMHSTPVRK